VDNLAVMGIAGYLLSGLIVPQSPHLGEHFAEFEAAVLRGLHTSEDITPDDRDRVMKWLHGLNHAQERRLAAILMQWTDKEKVNEEQIANFLASDGTTELLTEILGDDKEDKKAARKRSRTTVRHIRAIDETLTNLGI
jgi:hypothetical protein